MNLWIYSHQYSSETDSFSSAFLFKANFVIVETIIQMKMKPYNLSATIGNHFLSVFYIYIFLPVKAVFRRSENVFFERTLHSSWWNQDFCFAETAFFYLQLFFFLRKPLLALKFVSTSQNEGFSWSIVPTRQKKIVTDRSLKNGEKNGFY